MLCNGDNVLPLSPSFFFLSSQPGWEERVHSDGRTFYIDHSKNRRLHARIWSCVRLHCVEAADGWGVALHPLQQKLTPGVTSGRLYYVMKADEAPQCLLAEVFSPESVIIDSSVDYFPDRVVFAYKSARHAG